MTIGELKRLIAELDDQMPVLISGRDHSYNTVRASVRKVDVLSDVPRGQGGRVDPSRYFEYHEGFQHGEVSKGLVIT